jgi:hypothetical protein
MRHFNLFDRQIKEESGLEIFWVFFVLLFLDFHFCEKFSYRKIKSAIKTRLIKEKWAFEI